MVKDDQTVAYAKEFLKGGEFDNKLLPVMAYLKFNSNIKGRVGFSLLHMVKTIGYTPSKQSGRINDKIIEQLKWLQNGNYVSFDADLDGIKPKDFIVARINGKNNIFDMSVSGTDNIKPFVLLTEKEFDTIAQSDTRSDKANLLYVFVNIKRHITLNEYVRPICFPSMKTIMRDTGIKSHSYIQQLIDELVEIKVLFRYKCSFEILGEEKIKKSNNMYAIQESALIPEECDKEMIDYYAAKQIEIRKI